MIQSTFNVELDIKDFWSMKFHLSWFLVNISIFISLSKYYWEATTNSINFYFSIWCTFNMFWNARVGLKTSLQTISWCKDVFCNVLQCHGCGCVVKINLSVTVSGCYSYGYHLLFAEEVLQAIQKLFFPISFYVLIHGNLL